MEYMKVQKDHVKSYWKMVSAWVDEARGDDKKFSVEDIRVLCENENFDLWIVKDGQEVVGVLVACMARGPRATDYIGLWIGGVDILSWGRGGIDKMEEYATQKGYDGYTFAGRAGLVKALGIKPTGVYYYRKLSGA